MSIFTSRTLSYKQVAGIKLAVLSFAFLVAHYWPGIADWSTVWWIVFVLSTVYVLRFWLRK